MNIPETNQSIQMTTYDGSLIEAALLRLRETKSSASKKSKINRKTLDNILSGVARPISAENFLDSLEAEGVEVRATIQEIVEERSLQNVTPIGASVRILELIPNDTQSNVKAFAKQWELIMKQIDQLAKSLDPIAYAALSGVEKDALKKAIAAYPYESYLKRVNQHSDDIFRALE